MFGLCFVNVACRIGQFQVKFSQIIFLYPSELVSSSTQIQSEIPNAYFTFETFGYFTQTKFTKSERCML